MYFSLSYINSKTISLRVLFVSAMIIICFLFILSFLMISFSVFNTPTHSQRKKKSILERISVPKPQFISFISTLLRPLLSEAIKRNFY